jgi:hypothetical protein
MKIAQTESWMVKGVKALSAAMGLLCGVHCAFLPVATAALMALGISPFASAQAEVAMMLFAAAIAVLTFWPRATRDGNVFPLQASLLATAFFVAGWQMAWLTPLLRQSLSVSAGLMLVLAHAQSLWSTRSVCARSCP